MKNKSIDKLNEFCINEYDTELQQEDLKDLTKIQIMYTTYEDDYDEDLAEHLTVEVFVNIIDFKIWVEYNGIKVYEENYDNEQTFVDMLDNLDFDAWTNLDELDEYKRLKNMNNIDKIKELQKTDLMAIIKEITTGREGSALYNEKLDQVKIYIGNGDGSDDKWVSNEQFNEDYIIIGEEE